jgi:putative lipoprotein
MTSMLGRLTAFIAVALLHATPARADDPDPWFGRDKALHFGVSAGLAGAGYGVSSFVWDDRAARIATGAGFSLALGAGKELYDLSGHGDPSWKDFTWDVAGTAVGVGIALLVDVLVSHDSRTPPDVRAEPRTSGTQMAIRF